MQYVSIEDPYNGGKYTVKKYTSKKSASKDETWEHEEISLMSLNPDYMPIVIQNSEEGEFIVVAEFLDVLI